MPILRITVADGEPQRHDGKDALFACLAQMLRATGDTPVTVMIHGYKYEPGHPQHCPHRSILSKSPQFRDPRIVSWPRHLGLRDQPDEGLALSFGWSARGTIWCAHRRAAEAGDALARVLTAVQEIAPGRKVHMVAHSLGARVTLRALSQVAPGALARAVLLSAAEFDRTARAALQSPGGRAAEILNVTSRENDLFDFLMERLVRAPRPGDRMLGHGGLRLPNMATLQLDDAHSRASLRRAGFPVAPSCRPVCHWSSYVRAGLFPLYRAFLDGRITLDTLRALLPEDPAPRWSRLKPALPDMRLVPGLPSLR